MIISWDRLRDKDHKRAFFAAVFDWLATVFIDGTFVEVDSSVGLNFSELGQDRYMMIILSGAKTVFNP